MTTWRSSVYLHAKNCQFVGYCHDRTSIPAISGHARCDPRFERRRFHLVCTIHTAPRPEWRPVDSSLCLPGAAQSRLGYLVAGMRGTGDGALSYTFGATAVSPGSGTSCPSLQGVFTHCNPRTMEGNARHHVIAESYLMHPRARMLCLQ